MSSRTWIYIVILILVLGAGGVFGWWMYKTSKISPKAATVPTPTFSDVPVDYWAFTEIEGVNKAGIMVGYGKPLFKPDDPATRATVAVVVSRAYDKKANPATATFTDVPKTFWAYQEIEGMKEATYMMGESATVFNPDGNASRSALATVIARAAAGGDANVPAGPATATFTDVPTTDPFYKYIEYSKAQGIMTGVTDTTFQPDTPATRSTVAVAVSRAKLGGQTQVDGWTLPTTAPSFEDVQVASQFYKNIEYVNAQGYMVGYPPVGEKLFEPTLGATRATTAVAISRATNKKIDPTTLEAATFSDVPKEYWAFGEIEGVNQAGYMIGISTGVFSPDTVIPRRQAVVAIARAKNLPLPEVTASSFTDVPANAPDIKEIEAMYKAGYIQGCSQSPLKFCPDELTNRDALAVMMYRAFLQTAATSPSPQVSTPPASATPNTPTPTPATPTPTSTPTPTTTTTSQSSTTTNTTTPAKTGPEVPLVGAGGLSLLFLARYLVRRKIK